MSGSVLHFEIDSKKGLSFQVLKEKFSESGEKACFVDFDKDSGAEGTVTV